MSVFPDNIRRLGGWLNFNGFFTTEPFIKVTKFIIFVTIKNFLEVKGSLETFLKLESDENRDRSAPSLKFLLLQGVDFFINFSHLFPLFINYVGTSFTKKSNQFGIVVSKGSNSNIDVLNWCFFITKVRKLAHSQFNLVLDPDSKVFSMGLVVIPFKFDFTINLRIVNVASALQELFVERFSDIKLNGVITSSDGLNIPLNVVVSLHTSDVVNIDNHEERNENTHASIVKTKYLSVRKFCICVSTSDLNKKHRSG